MAVSFNDATKSASDYYGHARTEIESVLPVAIKNILEIGCGSGATMRWLHTKRNIEFCAGIELFPAAGEQAREVFNTVTIGPVDDILKCPLAHRFDVVMALDVLEHLPDPQSTLKLLVGLMQPGGVFIASLPNVGHYSVSWPLFFHGKWDYENEGHLDRTHLRFFSKKTALALFAEAGLKTEILIAKYITPNLFHAFGWRNAAARHYSKKILQCLPGLHHFIESQYIVAARHIAIPIPDGGLNDTAERST